MKGIITAVLAVLALALAAVPASAQVVNPPTPKPKGHPQPGPNHKTSKCQRVNYLCESSARRLILRKLAPKIARRSGSPVFVGKCWHVWDQHVDCSLSWDAGVCKATAHVQKYASQKGRTYAQIDPVPRSCLT